MELSKELLSEVLHCDVCKIHIKDNILEYDCDFDDVIMIRNINLYELAHKCKEWALDNNYELKSYISEIQDKNKNIYASCEIINACSFPRERIEIINFEKTEIEAIVKACQWILNNQEG